VQLSEKRDRSSIDDIDAVIRAVRVCPEVVLDAVRQKELFGTMRRAEHHESTWSVVADEGAVPEAEATDFTMKEVMLEQQVATGRAYTFGARLRDPIWELQTLATSADAFKNTPPSARHDMKAADWSGAATKQKTACAGRRDDVREIKPAALFGDAEKEFGDAKVYAECNAGRSPPASAGKPRTDCCFEKSVRRLAGGLLILLFMWAVCLPWRPEGEGEVKQKHGLQRVQTVGGDAVPPLPAGAEFGEAQVESARDVAYFLCGDVTEALEESGSGGGEHEKLRVRGSQNETESPIVVTGIAGQRAEDRASPPVGNSRSIMAKALRVVRRALVASMLATLVLLTDWLLFV
jgi:hypothetical protein